MRSSRIHDSRLIRGIFLGVGILSLALGLLGIFLPILPTTPFVLLSAGCFARGSQRLHDWLLAHRIAGPIIHEWQVHRSMPPGVKPWAFAMMAVSFGSSIAWMDSAWHRVMLAALGLALAFMLWRVPVQKRTSNRPSEN